MSSISDGQRRLAADLDCWYDNGFAASQWKLDKNSKWVTGCTLHLSDERFELRWARSVFHCPWPGTGVTVTSSDRGNAIVKVTTKGAAGGTAALVLPAYSTNAFWSELWRVVACMRPRLEAVRPEVLPAAVASSEVMLDYLGGYSLNPKKSFGGVSVSLGRFGVWVQSAIRRQHEILLPWRDVTAIRIDGMIDPQRQRSLARTVEFGVLGGLAGKQVKSAFLSVTTPIGEAVFHSDKMTAPELRAKLGTVLGPADNLIAQRTASEPGPTPAPAPSGPVSVADELSKLANLRDAGILSDEEFAAQKKKFLRM